MKTRAAVLREVSRRRPYGETRPVEIEELDLGAPRAGEVRVRTA
ncbi:alcohol dehydrogenase, partial [Streptomyces sp. SID625]|nr:alcohol dehydrogenase [Streptomyces sp. SID625]